jgi:hypothetical protein
VARGVCEKIAQHVFCQNNTELFKEKGSPKFFGFLSKENNRPFGGNFPNLVTLALSDSTRDFLQNWCKKKFGENGHKLT